MADLLRTSLMGTMPSGEAWSVNPCWALGDFGAPVTPAQVTAVVAAINALTVPTAMRSMWNATTSLTGCRVEARTVIGTLEAIAEGVRAAPVTGTGGATHPFQTSWVTSIRTDQVGGSGRGRMYWPGTGQLIDGDTLRPTGANVTATLDAVTLYLQSVMDAIRLTFDLTGLAVWSRTNNALYPARRLEMGDVLDTQRRRRDTLTETYQTVTWDGS